MKNIVSLEKLLLPLFAIAFFTVTWDMMLTYDIGGFTLKFYEVIFIFLLSATSIPFLLRGWRGVSEFFAPLRHPFARSMLWLSGLYIGLSPWSAFPLKSFLYSCWLIFDLLAIWLCTQHLASRVKAQHLLWLIWGTLLFLSVVILIDNTAYMFGIKEGIIGYNQDVLLNYGLSRPHAFANEPSYVASFICLGLLTTAPALLQIPSKKWFVRSSLFFILLALIATTSRTGWFSLVLGAGAFFFLPIFSGKKIEWRAILTFGMAIPSLALIFYLVTPAKQFEALRDKFMLSIVRGTDGSGNARLMAHVLAYKMAQETYGLGTGLGASYRHMKDHGGTDPAVPEAFNATQYGNEVIMSTWGQVLGEGGFVAPILFLLSAFGLLYSLFQKYKREGSLESQGSLAAALVFFLFMAFWLGNICRGDIWVWYALWSAFSWPTKASTT